MLNSKKQITGFIDFLNEEFSFSQKKQNKILDKKIVCETSKLQKVLDIFIVAEKNNDKRIIDDVLIEAWQKASEEQKKKILDSFLQKQRFKKNDLDEMLLMLNNNSKKFSKKTLALAHDWKNVLVTACFLAFVASVIIVRFFPGVADKVIANNNILLNACLKSSPEVASVNEDSNFFEEISKDDLSKFVQKNSNNIKKAQNKNPYSIVMSTDEIKGRVAGVSEESLVPEINIAVPDTSELYSVKKSNTTLMEKFVKKQVELAGVISQKLRNIFK